MTRTKVKQGDDGMWYASVWILDFRRKWTPITMASFSNKEDAMKWVVREEAPYVEG